jgi:hypothetical protein
MPKEPSPEQTARFKEYMDRIVKMAAENLNRNVRLKTLTRQEAEKNKGAQVACN